MTWLNPELKLVLVGIPILILIIVREGGFSALGVIGYTDANTNSNIGGFDLDSAKEPIIFVPLPLT